MTHSMMISEPGKIEWIGLVKPCCCSSFILKKSCVNPACNSHSIQDRILAFKTRFLSIRTERAVLSEVAFLFKEHISNDFCLKTRQLLIFWICIVFYFEENWNSYLYIIFKYYHYRFFYICFLLGLQEPRLIGRGHYVRNLRFLKH